MYTPRCEFGPVAPTMHDEARFGASVENPQVEAWAWQGYDLDFRTYFPYEIPPLAIRPIINLREVLKIDIKKQPWFYVLELQTDDTLPPEFSVIVYPNRIERDSLADVLVTETGQSKKAEVARAIGLYLHLRQLRQEHPDVCIFGRPIGETGMTDIGDSLWYDTTLLWKTIRYRQQGGTEEIEAMF